MNIELLLGYFAIGFFLVAGSFTIDYLRHGRKAAFMMWPVGVTIIVAAAIVALWLFLIIVTIGEQIMEDEGPF